MAHRRRRRCGPWCCRSVSSLGFALLTEDNLPRSAIAAAQAGSQPIGTRASRAKRVPSRASAGSSGCVRDASYASKTSLLTRGTQALAVAAQFALRAQPTRRLRRGCISRPSARRASTRGGFSPRRTCNAPRLWRIIRAGPSRQKLPQPTAQAWFAAYRMRLGRMAVAALCREGLTSSRFRRAWA